MPIVVPPGGFAGFAQQTPATQLMFQRAGRIGGRTTQRRRRRKAKAAAAPRRKRKNGNGKLRKGSAAMKRKMARLRARRKK